MDAQQLKINRLRAKAERQTLSFTDAKALVVAAGITLDSNTMTKVCKAADAHPMSLRMDPAKVDRWIKNTIDNAN